MVFLPLQPVHCNCRRCSLSPCKSNSCLYSIGSVSLENPVCCYIGSEASTGMHPFCLLLLLWTLGSPGKSRRPSPFHLILSPHSTCSCSPLLRILISALAAAFLKCHWWFNQEKFVSVWFCRLVSVDFPSVCRQQPRRCPHGGFLCVPMLWCLSFSCEDTSHTLLAHRSFQ